MLAEFDWRCRLARLLERPGRRRRGTDVAGAPPILRPDVVKLDLRLLQNRNQSSEPIVHAVRAYAESAGAIVLAAGIETEAHLGVALALGAVLGQVGAARTATGVAPPEWTVIVLAPTMWPP